MLVLEAIQLRHANVSFIYLQLRADKIVELCSSTVSFCFGTILISDLQAVVYMFNCLCETFL